MNDTSKTKRELLQELKQLRRTIKKISSVSPNKKAAPQTPLMSEQFAKSIINSSLDMIIATDINNKVFCFNEAARSAFGYTLDEIIKKSVNILYAQPKEATNVKKILTTKGEFTGEVRNKRKSGEVFTSYVTASILKDALGKNIGTVGISRDISDQLRTEQGIKESEVKYRSLFEGATDAIFTMNSDLFIDCNKMTLTMFGCTQKSQIVSHHPWEFSPEFQPDGTRSSLGAKEKIDAALQGAPQRFYWKHITREGVPFDAEVSLNRIEIGDRTLLQAIVRNITEDWQIRKDLRISEQKYRDIIDHAPIGFYQSDLAGKFMKVNAALVKILGYNSAEELMTKTMGKDIYFKREERERLIREFQQYGHKKDIEIQWRKKDGSPIWIQLNFHTVIDDGGQVKYFDGFVRDITERKTNEDILRESEKRHRLLFDQMLDGMYRSTHEGRFVAVNPAMAEMFGYSSTDEMMKVDIKKDLYFSPEDRASNMQEIGQEQVEEYLMKRKDGSPIWVEDHGRYIHDEQGNILYHEGMVRDITERKNAEKILRESESRFKAIFENSPIMIFVLEMDGTVISINSVAVQQLQYQKEELIGKNILGIFFEEDKPTVNEQFHRLQTKKIEQGNSQIRKVKKDGTVMWVNEHARVMQWTDGRDIVLITCEDITQQKLNDDALRKIEEENRAIVNAVPDIIFRLDRTGKFLDYRNPSQSPLYAPPEYFLGKMVADVLPADLTRTVMEKMERAFQTHRVESFEYELMLNNELRYFDDRIVALNDQEALSFIRDITERKASEQALRDSEYWLRESQRVGRIGSYNLDIKNNSWTSSHILDEIFGINEGDKKTLEQWNTLVHPEEQKEMIDYFLNHVVGGKNPFNKEYRIIRKRDGQTRWVWGLGELALDQQGIPVKMIGTIQDITERNILQNQLLQSQKVQSIGILAGGIAHDFNNILAIILAYTSRLSRGKFDEKQLVSSIEAINNAVERGAALVRQILTFARQTEISFKPLLITDVTHELCSMLRETFPKTITIEEIIRSDVSLVNADKNQIHQTLLNLCVNARDAMPEGGTITVTVNEMPLNAVVQKFPSAHHDSYVCITVADTGTGMNEETKEHIFDPFFTTKEKGKGTGLGLSVVFGVIQNHAGFIQVESAVKAGTTFTIFLPSLSKIIAVKEGASNAENAVAGGSETILLVEDELLLREFVESSLTGKGYTVIHAQDGAEAVQVYKERHTKIDLVLTDIGLPKISGVEEFKQLKMIDPAVKVILASGFFEPEAKAELVREGARGFIQKPYIMNLVLQKIRETLDDRSR